MDKIKVHLCRGGAPDKICLWHGDEIEVIRHDHTNLVDYDATEIYLADGVKDNRTYFLSADEGDIRHVNGWPGGSQRMILLPQVVDGGYMRVIDYDQFVPKDSFVYSNLSKRTSVRYPSIVNTLTTAYLRDLWTRVGVNIMTKMFTGYALKTQTGSGSRGVLLIDPVREMRYGGKYRPALKESDLTSLIEFADKEGCDIIQQDLIPDSSNLTKVNVDFVIKDRKLLGYKWDKTDPDAVFTNWNYGWFIRNAYTDKVMEEISDYLIYGCGIVNAIMNFEAFSDLESETWLVEFNWRYSNSMFEGQALGIDLISSYITGSRFEVPVGEHKFSRYWQCKLYSDIEGYRSSK